MNKGETQVIKLREREKKRKKKGLGRTVEKRNKTTTKNLEVIDCLGIIPRCGRPQSKFGRGTKQKQQQNNKQTKQKQTNKQNKKRKKKAPILSQRVCCVHQSLPERN